MSFWSSADSRRSDTNAITLPSAEIDGAVLPDVHDAAQAATASVETRRVTPSRRSKTYTSLRPLVSGAVASRLDASEAKATQRPSADTPRWERAAPPAAPPRDASKTCSSGGAATWAMSRGTVAVMGPATVGRRATTRL